MPYSREDNTTNTRATVDDIASALDANGALQRLRTGIDEVAPVIDAAKVAEEAAAIAAVQARPEFALAQDVGNGVRSVFVEASRELRTINRNTDLSLDGRRKATEQVTSRRTVALEKIAKSILGAECDKLLEAFPPPIPPSPTQDIAAESSLIMQSYSLKAPATFATEALAALRRAVAVSTPMAQKFRANQILYHAFGPLTARRADAPERFALSLQPVNAQLAGLIQDHLDTVFQLKRHEYAIEVVAQFRTDFTWLRNMAESLGGEWDDSLLTMGAGSFFPPKSQA